MNYSSYLAQVKTRLADLGFTEQTAPPDLGARLVAARREDWGTLYLLLPPAPAQPGAQPAREALVNATAAWMRSVRAKAQVPCYAIVAFPFERRVDDKLSAAIRSLQAEDARRQWGVIPWVVDLEVELVDRHTGFPRLDDRVARCLTEVPRGAVAEALRRTAAIRAPAHRRASIPLLGDLGEVPFTRITLAATVAFYLWTVIAGGGEGLLNLISGPNVQTLLRWGANDGERVLLYGEQWRLLTYAMLHGGLLHLGMNMYSLWILGRHVELVYGSGRTTYIYLIAGVTGGFASAVLRPEFVPSVGASGAIFGLLGALAYFAFAGRTVDWRSVLVPIGINLLIGFMWVGIDNYGHVGGLIGGFLAAFLCGIPGQRAPWRAWAMAGAGALAVGVLSGVIPLHFLR